MFLQRKGTVLLLEPFRYERQEKVQHIPQRNSILNKLWERENTKNFQELIKMQILRFKKQQNLASHKKIIIKQNKKRQMKVLFKAT